MKKKIVSIMLCVAIAACALTGCGKEKKEEKTEKSEKTIKVACMNSYTPYAFVDEDGNPTGYDIDVMKEAAKRAGYEIEITATDWDSLFPGLDSGKWDCVANQITRTEEREDLYTMGKVPYYMNSMKLVVKADSDVTGIDTLKGAKIDAIVGDYATGLLEDYLEENSGAFEIVYSEGTMAMFLEDIINGRVAGNVNDPFTINQTAKENGVEDQIKIVGDDLFTDYIFAAFAKNEAGEKMRDDFDAALKEMIEDGTLSELSNKYFNYDYNTTLSEGVVE